MAGIVAVGVVASAISLTNFVRRPELSGKEGSVEAYYETVPQGDQERTPIQTAAWAIFTFLRFINHYPSHLWLLALVGRLDLFFWLYTSTTWPTSGGGGSGSW